MKKRLIAILIAVFMFSSVSRNLIYASAEIPDYNEDVKPITLNEFDSLSEDEVDLWIIQLKTAIAFKHGILGSPEGKVFAYMGDEQFSLMDYSLDNLELVKRYLVSKYPEENSIPNPELSADLIEGLNKRVCELLIDDIVIAESVIEDGIDYEVYYKFADSQEADLTKYSLEELAWIKSYIEENRLFEEAEETETEELDKGRIPIYFRDIEWGLPYDDVVGQIPADRWFLFDSDYASPVRDDLIDPYRNITYTDYVRGYTYSKTDISVAGYPVDLIRIWFAYTPDDDGFLQQDKEHTAFYEAEYVLKARDMSRVYEDLTKKLTSLYGTPDEQGTIQHFTYASDTYTVWNGSNDAMVVLKTDNNSSKIRITYGWLKGNDFLDATYEALVNEEKSKMENGDTGGL